MAKQVNFIVVNRFMSDDSGDLVTEGHEVQYVVQDTVDPELRKGGTLVMDDIVTSDTVATWWGKVKAQVEAAEGI